MNKFLQSLCLLIIVSFIGPPVYGGKLMKESEETLVVNLCMYADAPSKQVERRLSYNVDYASFFSTNCNTPTILANGTPTPGTYNSGTDLYYSFSVPGGQHPNFDFTGSGDMTFEIIDNCVTQTPQSAPFCASGTYLIKVTSPSSTAGTFTITVTNYSSSVNISFTDTGGLANNDGIICEGDDITLTANDNVGAPATIATYVWSDGSTAQDLTITNATVGQSGTYTVTITDDNGCTATSSRLVTVNPLPNGVISVTETSGSTDDDAEICEGDQATLTASGGTTYLWDNGSTNAVLTVTPTVTTTYFVTITDANGCEDIVDQEIIVHPLPTAVIDITETSGNADDDGDICLNDMITLTASGGTSYVWSSGEVTDVINPVLPVGTHTFTVTVTDVNGCTDTEMTTVEVFPEPTADIDIIETSGNIDNDGLLCLDDQLTLEAVGGVSWEWNNGLTSQTINEFPAVGQHTYTVTVTDVNGCTQSSEVMVEVFDLPVAVIDVFDMSAEFDDDGLICEMENATLTASGGIGYEWSSGELTGTITVSPAVGVHTYTVTVTDVNGCTDTEEIDIEVFALPDPTYTIAETSGLVDNDGILCSGDDLTLTASDPDPNTEFEWTLPDGTVLSGNPLTITNIDITFSGVYTLKGDNNGCTKEITFNILVNDPPDPIEIQYDGSGADFDICEGEMMDLDVVIGVGMGPYTYDWQLPNGSTMTGNPISVTVDPAIHHGLWRVTVTDANGCTGEDDIAVTVNPSPPNDDCGSAFDVGTGMNPIQVTGNNVCALTGGPCGGPDNESAVFFTYTVPQEGLTRLIIQASRFFVGASGACGGGNCEEGQTVLECPAPGSVVYITLSSSEANEGDYSMLITPVFEAPPIEGSVFVDLDSDGQLGGNDIGLGGANILAYPNCDKGQSPISVTSNDDGSFTFENMLPGPPPTRFLITMDPSGDVTCDVKVEVCVTLDPCTGMLDPVLFPCPPPDCTSNPYSVDNICETALQNPLCDLRVIQSWPCGQNPLEYGPWLNQSQCTGGGVYHNTSFYGFVAGSGNYDINFTIFQCAGSGVQYGILDGVCSPGGPCVVYSGDANTGTVTINSSILTPCKTYVFWIDGWAGSVCSYYAFVTGDWHNCSVPPIIDISLDSPCDPLCPSFNPITVTATGDPASIPPVEEISGAVYYWDITNPDGTTSNYVIEGPDGLNIDYVFYQEGTYNICVTPYHPCDQFGKQYCEEFTFVPIEDEYKEFVVCTGDFPWPGAYDEDGEPIVDKYGNQYAWVGGEVTLAMVRSGGGFWESGSYYTNECGCQYLQQMRIVEAKTGTGYDSVAVCIGEIPFNYKGIIIEDNLDDFISKLEGVKTKSGCDSLVSLDARVLDMGGKITDECIAGGIELKFAMGLAYINADRDSLKYVWKDSNGNIIKDNDSDGTTIIVPGEGTYTLEVIVYKYGKGCPFTFTRKVDLTGRLPLAPLADNWPQKICEKSPEATYNVLNADPNLIYLWTVPSTATKIQDDSTGTLIVRWNGPVGGDICVKARNLCGDGPLTCLPVLYIDQIPPDFSLAADVCKDDATVIVATSTHTATPVIYNWNFDGGNPDAPVNNGPGPHNVRWSTTGIKTVTLTVTENGCEGDPVTHQIEVKELPPPPVISCFGGTSSSVLFGWTSVPGATDYIVTVISPSGVTGTIIPGQNQYEVTGLNLGATVTIEVTAVLPGPCGNITSVPHACTAEDCGELPDIAINPIAPICLPGTPIALDDKAVTVEFDIPGSVGTFTVNGNPATVFDPAQLGAGQHTIRYVLTWDNARCRQEALLVVTVNETPLSDFTVSPGGCVLDPVTVTYTGGTTGGVYTWNFGQDVKGTYNGAGPHQVTWTNAGTKTITLTVTKNGCTSTLTTKTVTVNPVLVAPKITCADQRIDGVTFGWDAVPNANSYDIVVEIVGGAVLFQGNVTDTQYDVSGIPEGTQVKITVTAVSGNGCPNTSSSFNCIATSCPPAKITFDKPVTTECLTLGLQPIPLTFKITNNLPNATPTVVWSSSNPVTNAAINNSTTPATLNPQLAGAGQHFIKVTYQQKDCIWEDSLLVTLKPVPVASFTSKDKICITDDLTVTYTGTNTGGRILTWENGGATRTDLTATSFGFKFPAPGTYTIGLKVTLNGCESELFTKQVVVEAVPVSPVITCSSRLDAVTFTWNAIQCATEYEVFINGVSKGKQTALTYVADNLKEGEKVEIEVRAISTCQCPVAPVKLVCEAKACPPVVISLTASQTEICLTNDVKTIQLTANVTGNTPDGKGTWSGTGVNANGVFDPKVAGIGTHEITYSYLDSTCPFESKISIKVNELPRIVWEVDNPNCYNDLTGALLYEIQGGTAPFTHTVDGTVTVSSPASGITSGSHTFLVTDSKGCSATQTFEVKIPAQPSFKVTGPVIVQLGNSATHVLDLSGMSAYINQIDSVIWFWNGKKVCSGPVSSCSSITNTPPKGPNNYEVIIYYNNGCSVRAGLPYVVTDLLEYFFPNIINPNSTSGNTIFKITSQDPSLWVKKMRIYDRWGNLVYIKENFSAYNDPPGWNGKRTSDASGKGGADVVQGVYVYIFEMSSDTDDDIVATGDVTVIK
ncbi:MAG TPA: gliding motility-associated C-terminal domain-containing protein [Saprospiraceae bacterium]|nr:gliding motility-associated C-terminal domain-containing protein [Saprospiraceae bacterium]HRO09106.1 gliding motility-associated C-terminal domain-containing protein [Saprospiraceae bacterium]HRP42480.1 gliding motility-associated C-terminal domain-containing protein [Saprospiraceae bacterium]